MAPTGRGSFHESGLHLNQIFNSLVYVYLGVVRIIHNVLQFVLQFVLPFVIGF